jgi:hypothetical protein
LSRNYATFTPPLLAITACWFLSHSCWRVASSHLLCVMPSISSPTASFFFLVVLLLDRRLAASIVSPFPLPFIDISLGSPLIIPRYCILVSCLYHLYWFLYPALVAPLILMHTSTPSPPSTLSRIAYCWLPYLLPTCTSLLLYSLTYYIQPNPRSLPPRNFIFTSRSHPHPAPSLSLSIALTITLLSFFDKPALCFVSRY